MTRQNQQGICIDKLRLHQLVIVLAKLIPGTIGFTQVKLEAPAVTVLHGGHHLAAVLMNLDPDLGDAVK